MDTLKAILPYYLLLIDLLAFCVLALDKRAAIKGKPRASEKSLFILAWLGGSLGLLLAMYLFHHKIRKPKFYLSIPLIIIIQAIGLFWFFSG